MVEAGSTVVLVLVCVAVAWFAGRAVRDLFRSS